MKTFLSYPRRPRPEDAVRVGQVETDETENGNGKLKRKTETESGNGKAENWKWSSQLFQELPFAHARTV